jgi:glycosyltransferase involved in cell wall biosynthesis
MSRRRIVSVAHSYCVALNRRLAHEIVRHGGDRWSVTAVAPSFMWGDLRPIPLERMKHEPCALEEVAVHFARRIHVFLYGRRLREILRRGADVVHGWEEPYVLAASQIALWTPRSARLVYATGQNISKRYPPPFGWAERYAMRRADGWVAFGRSVYDAMMTRPPYRRPPGRIIPLGVDMETFRPDADRRRRTRRDLGWTEDGALVVGFLGRFVPEKGVRLLMSCLDALPVPWRALFVGGGPLERELRQWADCYRAQAKIVTGVPHESVPAMLNAMDVLCAPSQTISAWREQFGRMLIEAFACGVPVIGSDSGEIPHVIADAGIVAGEADHAAWKSELIRLLEDRGLRTELAARGLDRARTRYAWPVVARQYLDFFAELCEFSPAARRH